MPTQFTDKLLIVDDIPAVTKLWNGRFRLEFFCQPSDKNTGWYKENIDKWLPAFGSLQDASIDNAWSYPKNEGVAYDNMKLVEASVPYVPSAGEHFIELVYETLTDAFVQEKDDVTDYELNGLRRVTRTLIAEAGVDYQKVVGTTAISHQVDSEAAVTLYLSDYEIEDTDAYRRVEEVWMERGVLSKEESQGPSSLPNSKQHVWEAFGEEPVMPGIVISKLKSEILGFTTYRYTSISNLNDGDPTVETLITYEETIDVKKPGFVEIKKQVPSAVRLLGTGGDVAYIETTPPTVGKLTATVTVEITTSSSADTPVAYNLDGVAVSATIMTTRITPLGFASGGTPIATASVNVDQQALHHYTKGGLEGTNTNGRSEFSTGKVEIVGEPPQYYEIIKDITLKGTASVATAGIYDSNVVPIFVGLDGTQYFRKTNYTLSDTGEAYTT